jgi:subtilisin
MSDESISRRRVLHGVAAGAAATGIAGETAADPPEQNDRKIVGLTASAGFDVARRRADDVHRELDFGRIGKALAGTFPDKALEGLENNPNVRYVEDDSSYHALAQTLPWGIDRVDADIVHDNGETGNGADVAIIDTGIDDDHEDLQANVGAGKAYVDCSGSNCNYAWSDDNDHGTHCAGIADAVDNSTGVVGVSTEATLHAVKVLDGNGSGSLSDVAAGIEYVADQGWDVGSLSLGASSGDQTLKDACQYAYDNGVLLVGAAGNDGPCSDCVGYPAAYSTVIAVSSTDEDDSLSSFSSTGSEVELAAPGGSIYSTVIGGYDTLSGTSMACPHVSGAGGQLMANGYTNTEARQQLQDTAEDIGLASNEQGHGLLDAEAAVLGSQGFSVSTDSATNVDGSSATLNGSLDNLDGASSANVYFEWRETGASSWNTTSTQTLSMTGSFSDDVTGLTEGAEYEFRAVGEASDGDTDTGGTVTFTATNCVDATKWPSGSGVSGYEYITDVDLDGQVVESSSDDAYYDFTCPDVVSVQPGGSFDLALDYEDSGYDSHYANVYVDWDNNEDWSTATETRIMENVSDDSQTYTATVDVPS